MPRIITLLAPTKREKRRVDGSFDTYISFVGLFSRARRNAFETGGGSKLDFVASTILFPFQLPAAIMGRALVTVNHRDRRCDKWIINREEEGFDLRSSIFIRSKSISTISIENLSIFSTRFPFLSVFSFSSFPPPQKNRRNYSRTRRIRVPINPPPSVPKRSQRVSRN